MADADASEIVIVDEHGLEHVFPAGTDPRVAARIVADPVAQMETHPLAPRADAVAKWAGTKEGIGSTWPIIAGAVGAANLPMLGAAATTAGRLLTRPAVAGTIGAVAGGIRGYQRGGLLEGIEGAVRGGFEGGVGGRAIHGPGGWLRRAGTAAPIAAAEIPRLVTIAGKPVDVARLGPAAQRLVLSPETAASETRLETLASGSGTLLGAAGDRAKAARAALLELFRRDPE